MEFLVPDIQKGYTFLYSRYFFFPVKLVPPSKPYVTRLSNTSVMVRWNVPRNDGLPIIFFKVQYKEVGRAHSDWETVEEDIAAHIHSYAVTDLKPG